MELEKSEADVEAAKKEATEFLEANVKSAENVKRLTELLQTERKRIASLGS